MHQQAFFDCKQDDLFLQDYRYVGKEVAKEIYEEGITLEEYYRKEDQIKGWLKSDDGSGD